MPFLSLIPEAKDALRAALAALAEPTKELLWLSDTALKAVREDRAACQDKILRLRAFEPSSKSLADAEARLPMLERRLALGEALNHLLRVVAAEESGRELAAAFPDLFGSLKKKGSRR
jgi:hypothetical protein